MCGIVGYAGSGKTRDILVGGLKKLEYRGYDSAGLALLVDDMIRVEKTAGTIEKLENMTAGKKNDSSLGIGHTRWATHGAPTDENSHPHVSCCKSFALVHNGIIENHRELRARLLERGHQFVSQTDTEVLTHLVEEYYAGDLLGAVQRATAEVKGSYALVVISSREPGKMICARKDSPLIIGLGEKENLVASDIPALLAFTRRVYILEDGEYAVVTAGKAEVVDREGSAVAKEVIEVQWDAVAAEKGGYEHFMLKEIMEQPAAVKDTLRRRIDEKAGRVILDELNFTPGELRKLEKIFIVACGTAYHAGLAARYALEKLAGVSVEVELASEFRYREPLFKENQLVLVVSQSGETADTLAALRLARRNGVRVVAVTNVVGSSAAREAGDVLFTWAGPEVAVASTKAYLTQLIALYLFTIYLAEARESITSELRAELVEELALLPGQLSRVLQEGRLRELRSYSGRLARWEDAFFLGRGMDYAVALEGALKLKEISYIHAEACAAGELKHGTLALITPGIPVIALATQNSVIEKTMSNLQEVKARGGEIFLVTQEEREEMAGLADTVFFIPAVRDILAPVLAAVPLQLIAYYTSAARNCSIDKPRNLAKSVTVE